MAELITVPTFTFNQGDLFEMEEDSERPIRVNYYYDGSICLIQDGANGTIDEIIISGKHLNALFREIKKHLPEAEKKLKSKNP